MGLGLFKKPQMMIFLTIGLIVVFLGGLFYSQAYYKKVKKTTLSQNEEMFFQNHTGKEGEPEEQEGNPQTPAVSSENTTSSTSQKKTIEEKIKEAEEFARRGEYDKAILIYEEIIKDDPHNISAYNSLATLYAKKRDKEKALDVIKKGLENNPGNFSLIQTKDLIEYVWFNE